jgi:hypothetical protein
MLNLKCFGPGLLTFFVPRLSNNSGGCHLL